MASRAARCARRTPSAISSRSCSTRSARGRASTRTSGRRSCSSPISRASRTGGERSPHPRFEPGCGPSSRSRCWPDPYGSARSTCTPMGRGRCRLISTTTRSRWRMRWRGGCWTRRRTPRRDPSPRSSSSRTTRGSSCTTRRARCRSSSASRRPRRWRTCARTRLPTIDCSATSPPTSSRGGCDSTREAQEENRMTREAAVAQSLVDLADTLVDDYDVVDLLTALADRCVEVLDFSAAGVMLASPEGELRLVASSSEAMRVVELFELQAQEGPCLEAFRTGEHVGHEDLRAEAIRWPRFAAFAVEAGFQSAFALPLRLRSSTIGALNVFNDTPESADEDDVRVARAFADLATISVLQQQQASEYGRINEQLAS